MSEDLQPITGATGGDAQAIIDVTYRASIPTSLDPRERFHAVVTPDGVEVIDLEKHDLDAGRERPRRKTGIYRVHDAASFTEYLKKHGLPETEVWADASRQQLVAVVNGHLGTSGDGIEDYAGWGDHKVMLELRQTPAWQAWTNLDRKLVNQSDFAEHLEDRLVDVVRPAGAEMLELAQTFQATVGLSFESSKQLSSGERQLEYRENTEARAGKRGQLEIPKDFELGLIPFEGAEAYKVTARFRYRITDGSLRVGFLLDRPEDVLRMAFLDIVTAVENDIDAPMFRGVSAC